MNLNTAKLLPLVPHIAEYAPHLAEAAKRWDISTPLRQAHWLAQIAVESAAFSTVVESLNYREDRLVPLFGTHRISLADAHKFGRSTDGSRPAHQNALANILYGGAWGKKNLGNLYPGDGWKFRGHGLKQITGRYNFTETSHALYGDDRLVRNPELLAEPEAAALSAGYFWHWKKLNAVADTDDVEAVTRVVNGGTNGLDGTGGRRWWLDKFKKALGA